MLSALRARGVLRTAITWAIGLSALASTLLIGGVLLGVVPSDVFGIRELVAVAARTFVAGGFMGAVFALSVARSNGGRQLSEIGYGRFGASGFVGGAALGLGVILAAPGVLPRGVASAGALGFGLLGTGFSVATLTLARRADRLALERRLAGATQSQLPLSKRDDG